MPTLSFHASAPLAKTVKRTAARQKRKVSELLAEAVDRGLQTQQPGSLLGCCASLSQPGKAYDPSLPVIPSQDWDMLKP
jgi:hypothetical protein